MPILRKKHNCQKYGRVANQPVLHGENGENGPPPENGPPQNEDNGPPPPVVSDIRLKRDIANLVTLENGIKLYSFRYLWDDTVYVGVMAQDLLAHESYRDAVTMTQAGFYVVHYEMLGLRMITLNEWNLNQDSIYTN